MRKTRKSGVFLACLILFCQVFVLAGCMGRSSAQKVTGIAVNKEGRITATIVEPFDKDYYTVDGLKTQIEEEIASYENAGAITLETAEEVTVENEGQAVKSVCVVIEYATGEDYRKFNGKSCFYGTVEEARNSGFAFDGEFANAKGEKKELGLTDLTQMKDFKVLIVEEDMAVSIPGKMQYMTAGAELKNNSIITHSEELTYVIMK